MGNSKSGRRQDAEVRLIPIREFFRAINVGHTKGYEMVRDGTIETVMVGHRRYGRTENLERIVREGAPTAQHHAAAAQ